MHNLSCVIRATFISAFSLFLMSDLNAQIRIDNSENVQIGPYWGGSPQQTLFVNGSAHFNCYPAQYGGFFFENYPNGIYNEPVIRPNEGHNLWLGLASKPLWRVFAHTMYTTSIQYYSDSTLKTNVRPMASSDAMEKVEQMKSYIFDYNESAFPNTPDSLKQRAMNDSKNVPGLMAQEVLSVYPEAVKQDTATGLYSVDYIRIIPLLIEAIKDQEARIDSLENLLYD